MTKPAIKKMRVGLSAKLLIMGLALSLIPILLTWYELSSQMSRMQTLVVKDATEYANTLEKLHKDENFQALTRGYTHEIVQEFESAISRLRLFMLGLFIALSLLLVVASRYFARRFSSPVEQLEEAVRNWDGKTQIQLPIEGRDEAAELARAVHMMTTKVAKLRAEADERSRALEQADSEMMALNLSLEKQIDKRTRSLQKALEKLQTLDKSKDEFLSLITHELKTPLTSISACAEALSGRVDLPEDTRRQFIHIIHDESNRLTRLINEVLDYSRISAGKLPFLFRKADLVSLVERAVLQHRPTAEQKEIAILYKSPTKNDDRLYDVRMDPDRITQVLSNLLGNAIKFTSEKGSITVELDVLEKSSSTRKQDFALIRIKDTGIGIAAEDRIKVFERFSQAGPIEHHSEGTGLGMPIAKGIVVEHKGKMWFTSAPGKGSTFYFTLPLDRKEK